MTALRGFSLALIALSVAGLAAVLARALGPGWSPVDLGPLRVEFGLVNLMLFSYIAALLWLLARYTSTNLRGQERLARFGALFVGVGVSLLVLVLAGNLVTIAVAWTSSGVLLGFLVSHTGSASARTAGRRVQRAMAFSSGLLWVAVLAADFADLALDGTDTERALVSGPASLVAVLLVLAAAIRSALAPFHRWLPETAEAPSPVSALLHAGIVNAAGVIAVLQWDLLSAQPVLLVVLAIGGLSTVVWCSLEQRVRPDVKGRLAASTSAQMGWMALQIGLGAPAAALLHLMGHGAWKAWLFLRAGGAVVRARRETSRGSVVWSRAVASCLLALTPALGLIALVLLFGWWDAITWAPVQLLLLGISLLVAVVVGIEAAALERSSTGIRWMVAAAGGLAVAGYLGVAVWWDHEVAVRAGLSHFVPPESAAVAVPVVVVVVVAVAGVIAAALLAGFAVRLTPGSHQPVATLVSSTSLPPGSRLATRVSRSPARSVGRSPAIVSAIKKTTVSIEPDVVQVRRTVEMAGMLMGPAWPLRATVAVNPLAGTEVLPFDTALSLGERFHRTSLRPSFAWFLDLYDEDRISGEALAQAMDDHGVGGGPRGIEGLLELTREIVALEQSSDPQTDSSGEADRAADTARAVAHAHLWAARAWHRVEDRAADLHGPWQLWKRSAEHPIYRLVTGAPDATSFARSLPEDPAEAIIDLLDRAGHAPTDLFDIVTGVLAAGPGWVAHAQWRARRSASASPLVELIALRLALTVLQGNRLSPDPMTPATPHRHDTERPLQFVVLQKVWLDALDLSTRDLLCRPLAARQARPTTQALDLPTTLSTFSAVSTPSTCSNSGAEERVVVSQSVWCIDVRSERMRRNLESTGEHETFGFAGFFGILGRATYPDGTSFDQCPVIVTPTINLEVTPSPLEPLQAMTLAATRVAARPGLGFAVAEASGAAAFTASLTASLAPQTWRQLLDRAVRGRTKPAPLTLRDLADPTRELSVEEQTDAAESMLRTIGLTNGFALVVILTGHGSTTENNAYATAYDCGACGGNPGLLNAQAMAQVLNAPAVRAELKERGIHIPENTRVLAALHDTTTDQVTIQHTSPARADDLQAAELVQPALDVASRLTAAERQPTLPPPTPRPVAALLSAHPSSRQPAGVSMAARATDWSEPMPEWGLAGCAAIIVGPRHLTRGINLGGRTFLHSYDRHHDPDGSILTAILNAPVVVSQWIASQYWFSSVAPTALGAGDKTTHNVLGDIGVLSGAHGDLRTGLPWQALFARDPGTRPKASSQPQHIPSRHLVVIDADPTLLVHAVRQSPAILTLLTHNWMRMVAIDQGHILDVMSLLIIETDNPAAPQATKHHTDLHRPAPEDLSSDPFHRRANNQDGQSS